MMCWSVLVLGLVIVLTVQAQDPPFVCDSDSLVFAYTVFPPYVFEEEVSIANIIIHSL